MHIQMIICPSGRRRVWYCMQSMCVSRWRTMVLFRKDANAKGLKKKGPQISCGISLLKTTEVTHVFKSSDSYPLTLHGKNKRWCVTFLVVSKACQNLDVYETIIFDKSLLMPGQKQPNNDIDVSSTDYIWVVWDVQLLTLYHHLKIRNFVIFERWETSLN